MSEPLLTRLAAGIPEGEGISYAVILLEECYNEIERLNGLLVGYRGAIQSIGSIVAASRELDPRDLA